MAMKSCSICGTPAETFESQGHGDLMCPHCKSFDRQRVFIDLYRVEAFGKDFLENKRVLHISPYIAEKMIFSQIPGAEVVTIDIRPTVKPDIVADICAMPEVPTGVFDVAFACGVFQHVERPLEAAAELFRVLKPMGHLLCTSPLMRNKKTTEYDDYSRITAEYGKEAYDKWRVGFFRSFGELDYAQHFSPYFEGKVYFGEDAPLTYLTGVFWGLKNTK